MLLLDALSLGKQDRGMAWDGAGWVGGVWDKGSSWPDVGQQPGCGDGPSSWAAPMGRHVCGAPG